jgi:hypothetical protein
VVLPPAGHIALIDALFSGAEIEPWKAHVGKAARALFREQSGDETGALADWRELRAALNPNEVTLRSRADAAIRRLQPREGKKTR